MSPHLAQGQALPYTLKGSLALGSPQAASEAVGLILQKVTLLANTVLLTLLSAASMLNSNGETEAHKELAQGHSTREGWDWDSNSDSQTPEEAGLTTAPPGLYPAQFPGSRAKTGGEGISGVDFIMAHPLRTYCV